MRAVPRPHSVGWAPVLCLLTNSKFSTTVLMQGLAGWSAFQHFDAVSAYGTWKDSYGLDANVLHSAGNLANEQFSCVSCQCLLRSAHK
jgi:hypothetical protein